IDSLFESTPQVDVQASTTVALTAPTLPPPTIPTISQVPQEPTPSTTAPKNSNDEGNDDASLGLNVGNEGQDAEDDNEELYRDVNIKLEGRDVQMTDVHTTQEFEDTHVTLTPVNPDGQQQSSSMSS
nr:hypothetical protein [Tanacetum cinerariifolium]